MTPAELFFARNLRLPIDLLRGNLPKQEEVETSSLENFVETLKKKLEKIHSEVRKTMNIKSSRVKSCMIGKLGKFFFKRDRVWFYNPQRVKGKVPKLRSNWEGPYSMVKKFNDVVFCIQKTSKHKKKVVHADRLAPFLERNVS